ncbi:ThiF family adenylyltransferase [Flavobacteriaceae bacterium F08102]|nr:ThiF family adenylyltransferase [Flavobacteriaceae bacterium F08102]
MKLRPKDLYQRQISLRELGEVGQEKLTSAKVVIIGCGGLGSVAAVYLAGSGIGHLHLVDFDKIDASNLHRQVFYTPQDIGQNKATVLAKYLESINPFITVSHSPYMINKQSIFDQLNRGDYILDCTDHLWTKYLINDACVIKKKTLIYGSLYKFTGYIATFNAKIDGIITGNLRDVFPEIPEQHIPNCAEIGTLNTIVGMIGIHQANEVLKLISGLGTSLINQLLIYNSLENTQHKIKYTPTLNQNQIETIFKKTTYSDDGMFQQNEAWLITATELKKILKTDSNPQIISVIEDISTSLPFEVTTRIPLSQFDKLSEFIMTKINKEKPLILVCQRGISSYIATSKLKNINSELRVYSLINGIINF